MSDLAGWLLEQIADDERMPPVERRVGTCDNMQGVHLERQRWLAECDAKRRIIALHPQADQPYAWMCGTCGEIGQEMDCTYPCDTLRLLALPYADRLGYREEWKP